MHKESSTILEGKAGVPVEVPMAGYADTPGGILGFGLGRVRADTEEHQWWRNSSRPTPPDTLVTDPDLCRIKFRRGGT